MVGIDELLTAIMGQTDTAMNAPPAPWQQELLETVNPEKVKRQNIARALAKASTAMATTPGNFLSGVSAAAATGADSYLTGREQGESERVKVQQLVQMQQQKDRDRRLSLLMDAVGVQQKGIQEKRDAENHELTKVERKARTDYYNRRGTGQDGQSLNANQVRIAKQSILDNLDRMEKGLRNPQASQPWLDEDQIQQKLLQEQDRLERIIGVRLNDPDPSETVESGAPQVVQPGKVDQVVTQSPGITQPPTAAAPAIREGTTAINDATGQRMVYRNGKWQPL